MHSVDYYVNKIEKNSPKVKHIHLTNKNLSDADLAPLFAALEANPESKQFIQEIHLNGNELKVFKLRGFPALRKLHLAHNQLYELELEDLPAITHLYASDNHLHLVEIDHLTTLQVASFIGNSLVATHIKDLLTLRKLGLTGNDLSLASKIALKAINFQSPDLKIDVSHAHKKHRINQLTLPRIDAEILYLHFKHLAQHIYPAETLDLMYTVALVCTQNGRVIPAENMGIIMDFLLPKKYLNVFDRNVEQLQAAFTRRINQVYAVNPPPSRHTPALQVISDYVKTDEFRCLRSLGNYQSTSIVTSYSAGIKKLRQDKLKEAKKKETVVQPELPIGKLKARIKFIPSRKISPSM